MEGQSGSAEWVLSSSVSFLAVWNGYAWRRPLWNLKYDVWNLKRKDPMRQEKDGDRAKSPLRPWEEALWLRRAGVS